MSKYVLYSLKPLINNGFFFLKLFNLFENAQFSDDF